MKKFFSGIGIGMFLLGVALAIGFMTGTQSISQALVKMRQANNIRVKGYAGQAITSDYGTWRCSVSVRAATLPAAYARLEKDADTAKAFLLKNGVKESDITPSDASFSTNYERDKEGNATNTIHDYQMWKTFEVSSADVATISRVSKIVTTLIKDGVEVTSYKPEYTYSKLDEIKMQLLGKATEDGYSRAATLAANSHGAVGPLCSASQGVFQITPLHSTEVSGEGVYDTSTIDKEIKAVVTLEFNIEKRR